MTGPRSIRHFGARRRTFTPVRSGETTRPGSRGVASREAGPDGGASDLRWLGGVWAVVLVFAAVTAFWSHHVGVPLRDPEGQMFQARLAKSLVLFGVVVVGQAAVLSRRGRGPRALVAEVRDRWPRHRLGLATAGLVAYHAVYICYRNLKSWNAFRDLDDEQLVRLERWVFAGHSPAELLHALLGQHTAAYVLMVVYRSFTYVVPLSVVLAVVLVPRVREAYIFLTAAMWVWILGTVSYYLVPSLGPYAASPGDFAGLSHTAITDTQAEYLTDRAHLLAQPQAGDAFASLGAFASLHVAFSCMIFLMVRYYGLRRLTRVLGCYVAAVMVATVYLGWHYVADDIAGVLIAVTAVALGRAMVHAGSVAPREPAAP
jgi:membrane-associated phospholipid phosphatase